MSKVRFALVGCGAIAKKHAHALHHHVDEAEIGAFVDRDLARAREQLTLVERVKVHIGSSVEVAIVAPGSLPRSEGKLKRLYDLRG